MNARWFRPSSVVESISFHNVICSIHSKNLQAAIDEFKSGTDNVGVALLVGAGELNINEMRR